MEEHQKSLIVVTVILIGQDEPFELDLTFGSALGALNSRGWRATLELSENDKDSSSRGTRGHG